MAASQLSDPLLVPSGFGGVGAGRSNSASLREEQETPEAKRRKIRKGTRSCWECKRRKIRCNFPSESDAVCNGCRRRHTHCLSQEYPEEASRPAAHGQEIGDRIVRVEALVEQLVRQASAGQGSSDTITQHQPRPQTSFVDNLRASSAGTSPTEVDDTPADLIPGLPTPGTTASSDSARVMSFYDPCAAVNLDSECLQTPLASPSAWPDATLLCSGRTVPALPEKLQRLSNKLCAVLPSPKDILTICRSTARTAAFSPQVLSSSYTEFEADGLYSPEQMAKLPCPDSHPVIIARYMLVLATFLQSMPPNSAGLAEPPQVMMQRLVDTAGRLITTNEELVGTVESLECIMLEGLIQSKTGNLRRSWLTFRRAQVVGQLMGIHRSYLTPLKKIDPNTKADPRLMWYRILHADKYLCLMLGLPQGTIDTSFADESVLAKDTDMGRLERLHVKIATHILSRNEGAPDKCEFRETRDIDLEIQEAAKVMPVKWWASPNLAQLSQSASQDEMFWESIRMVNQCFHFNLLNQLHLPYMLRFSPDRRYDYSKMACMNASRELLSRFVAFRTWNSNIYCCRSIDFFALMAAMTLLLAHLESHRQGNELNPLVHQRLSDRAMMENVLENMDMVSRLNLDVLSEKSSSLLRRLLAIEADAAEGKSYHTQSISDLTGQLEKVSTQTNGEYLPSKEQRSGDVEGCPYSNEDQTGVLWMCIPYFGVIRIARDGGITKRPPAPNPFNYVPAPTDPGVPGQPSGGVLPEKQDDMEKEDIGVDGSLGTIGGSLMTPPGGRQPEVQLPEQHHEFSPEFPNTIEQALQTEYAYPGLTASVDDWAFQGVDMAFFDSLMKGIDAGGESWEFGGE